MIQNIRPTSKVALKITCLQTCGGDIDKADKLYKYLSDGLDELPTFDVQQPTTMQQIKDGAVQTFKWVNENQDTIMNWVGIIKDIFSKNKASNIISNNPLPPINK